MGRFAERTGQIDVSGIRKVFDLAAKLDNPVNFSIGQPDFDVPDEIKESVIESIRNGKNRYTVTQGIPELRDRIMQQMKDTRDWQPDEVFISSGVSGALLLLVMALVEEGDEVIIPDPFFLSYKQLTKVVGGTPVFVDTYPDFRLTAEKLEKVITPKSKVMFVNSPSNPTGAVYNEEDLKGVVELCRRHNIIVITDEIYEDFCYDEDFVSITKLMPEAVLVGGFSKSYAMTGWRLGYACGPADILAEMKKIQQLSFVCAPAMVQWAGVAALDCDISKQIAEFKTKRDLIYNGLKDKFEVNKPAGAFYIFPKAPGGDDMEFARRAIEKECLIIPGSVFSERGTHFRISYATTIEQIEKGLDLLNSLA